MQCKAELRIAVKHFKEWFITTPMRICEHFRKIADRLVGVNAKKQRNRLGHRVLRIEKRLTTKIEKRLMTNSHAKRISARCRSVNRFASRVTMQTAVSGAGREVPY